MAYDYVDPLEEYVRSFIKDCKARQIGLIEGATPKLNVGVVAPTQM